jgi:hypothetical protein
MPVDPDRFSTRTYREGDEQAILDLFARSFHAPRALTQWRWKFQQNPYGRERISLTFDAAQLVGHYAGYPVPFAIGEDDVVANQIGDTMTDPSIRHIGRGPSSILGRTALHFYEHFCEGKVAFNYGFNVANIQKFSLRFLRSDRVEPVTYRVRDLRQHALPPLRRIERWPRGISLDLVRSTAPEWDAFFDRVREHYGFLSRRDAAYVQWRYLDCPEPSYTVVALRKWRRLVGWIVFRIREDRFSLGDMLIDPDHADVLEAGLRHLSALFPTASIEAWCPPRPSWLDQFLRDLRFENRPEPQDLSVMCVPFMRKDAVEAMRSELFYTMGDSDLF